MAADLAISIEGVEELRKQLGVFTDNDTLRRLNREIGFNVQERTADWIAQASVTRHKTADELGAPHTGYLEFAPGRMRSFARFKGKGGAGTPEIHTDNDTAQGVDIVIENTPGLRRAFGPMTITPKKAKALTIPKDKVSYGRSVSELKAEGHVIYRPKGTRILVEDIAGKAKKDAKPNWRVLFILTGKVNIKHDPKLLPDGEAISDWASDTAEAFIELESSR